MHIHILYSIMGTGCAVSPASWSLIDAAAATNVAICVGSGVSGSGFDSLVCAIFARKRTGLEVWVQPLLTQSSTPGSSYGGS